MDALIIFSDDNAHPLGFILNKKHRHVWCATKPGDFWVVYNWHHGVPLINVVDGQLDLAAHYRDEGCKVIETTVGDEPCHGPWMCNNCVGHTMVICGIRTHLIFTPQQLWNHLTGNTLRERIQRLFIKLCFVPGFGGGKTVYLPAPAVAVVAPQSEMSRAAEFNLSEADQKRLKVGKFRVLEKKKKPPVLSSEEDSGGDREQRENKPTSALTDSRGVGFGTNIG
jgi:hypothetical protein